VLNKTGPQSIHILRGVRQQQDEPGRFSICSRQAAVVHQPDALHPEDVSIYAHSRLSFCHPILLHRFCCIDTVTGFVTAGERFIV
ncbi:hypothetical protein ACNAQM_26745, partial [Escherichia coli]|uniref:hypothetical protein n=1 Tax=Escherichia coli TaxID=562 RepID=UPI003A4E2D36